VGGHSIRAGRLKVGKQLHEKKSNLYFRLFRESQEKRKGREFAKGNNTKLIMKKMMKKYTGGFG